MASQKRHIHFQGNKKTIALKKDFAILLNYSLMNNRFFAGVRKLNKDEKSSKIAIPDITLLSEIFLETLKDVSKSGNVLNTTNFSMFLAKKQYIKDLLRLAKKAQEDSLFEAKNVDLIKGQTEQEEERKKETYRLIMDLESKLDFEKDFNKRATIMLINISKIGNNEAINQILDDYKLNVMDETDITKKEEVLHRLRNQLLKTDIAIPQQPEQLMEEREEKPELPQKKSMLRKFFGDSSEISLPALKKNALKAVDEIEMVLGDDFSDEIEILKDRILKCENIDYLFSLRKQIIDLFQHYSDSVRKEREQITEFIKQVGKKLTEVEEDIITSFSSSNDEIADDLKFSEKIGVQVKNIEKSFETNRDFDKLRTFIVSELLRISTTLEEKRRDYISRLEKTKEEQEKVQQKFEKMLTSVVEQNKMLIEQNQKDPLTGAYNRGTFDERSSIEFQRYQRYGNVFSLIMFDLDNFKFVNDTYGHIAGDRVLKGISKAVKGIIRDTDVFARYGGEEFIILLTETKLKIAYGVAEKIRETIHQTEFIYESQRVPVSISAGVTEVKKDDRDLGAIYERTDKNLYKAKMNGRNQVFSDTKEA